MSRRNTSDGLKTPGMALPIAGPAVCHIKSMLIFSIETSRFLFDNSQTVNNTCMSQEMWSYQVQLILVFEIRGLCDQVRDMYLNTYLSYMDIYTYVYIHIQTVIVFLVLVNDW